jgi:7-keto-8-aminopelargonate synthetase-like enzyme
VGAAYAALELIQQHPERIKRLWQNANLLKSGLAGLGWSLQSETPILPLILGKATNALAFGNALFQAGVFIAPIRPPSVPEGSSRLRVTPTAAHTTPQLQSALEAFSLWGKALGLLS